MDTLLGSLPSDPDALRAIIRAQHEELVRSQALIEDRDTLIAKLKAELAILKRARYGRSSEKIERAIEQLELALEDIEAGAAEAVAGSERIAPKPTTGRQPARQVLPDHLPRETVIHDKDCVCAGCGGTQLKRVGEDVTETLDYVPASFRVVRHVRARFACRDCDAITHTSMLSLPIERGKPGPGLLAHVLVAKYCDHLPLYRQSEIYASEGVDIARSTMADWVGRASTLMAPLVEAVRSHVFAGDRLHGDDTPVPILEPGRGRTRQGRLWTYVRDGRPHGTDQPPAACYFYSPDRKGEHPQSHLNCFAGMLHADGYAGFNELYRADRPDQAPRILEAACWAHVRRKFLDLSQNGPAPIAEEVLRRIGELYGIEADIRGAPPDRRRTVRQDRARPKIDALHDWLEDQSRRVPGKSVTVGAIRYALSRWKALCRYLDDGTIEIDNNAAERAIRPIALGRKNWLFAGSDRGGERAAAILTLIETARLNDIDPEAYLREVLTRIADHPINKIGDLLPWNIATGDAA